jgi:hypothetical protein
MIAEIDKKDDAKIMRRIKHYLLMKDNTLYLLMIGKSVNQKNYSKNFFKCIDSISTTKLNKYFDCYQNFI